MESFEKGLAVWKDKMDPSRASAVPLASSRSMLLSLLESPAVLTLQACCLHSAEQGKTGVVRSLRGALDMLQRLYQVVAVGKEPAQIVAAWSGFEELFNTSRDSVVAGLASSLSCQDQRGMQEAHELLVSWYVACWQCSQARLVSLTSRCVVDGSQGQWANVASLVATTSTLLLKIGDLAAAEVEPSLGSVVLTVNANRKLCAQHSLSNHRGRSCHICCSARKWHRRRYRPTHGDIVAECA